MIRKSTKLVAGVGVVAAGFAVLTLSAAQAATLPDLTMATGTDNFSNIGIGGSVTSLPSGLLITGSESGKDNEGHLSQVVQLTGDFGSASHSTEFAFSYAFDLTQNIPATINANVKATGTGMSLAPMNPTGAVNPHLPAGSLAAINVPVPAPAGGGTVSAGDVELFKKVGSSWVLESGGTGTLGAGGLEILSYAHMTQGDYLFVVVGQNLGRPVSVGSFAGNITLSAVPLPGALALFGTGLVALGAVGRKRFLRG